MNSHLLSPGIILGLDDQVKKGTFLLNDGSILYFASNSLAISNPETKAQKILPIHEGQANCAAISPGENYIAVGLQRFDKAKDKPHILIIDLHTFKRKRFYTLPNLETKKFEALEFSNDCKHLLVLGSEPDWSLYLFQWEKGVVSSQIKAALPSNTPITSIAINPFEIGSIQVSVIGGGFIRSYRVIENAFKIVSQIRTDKVTTCQAWAEDQRLLVGTKDASLLVIENGDLALKIQHVSSTAASTNLSIQALLPTRAGLFVGNNSDTITYYEKTEDLYLYKKAQDFFLFAQNERDKNDNREISALITSQTTDNAVILLSTKEMFSFAVSELAYQATGNSNAVTENMSNKPKQANQDVDKDAHAKTLIQQIPIQMHSKAVSGLDMSIRKPYLVSCSQDKTLRVWNYRDWSCDIKASFTEEPHAVAMHPSGLYLAVALNDSVQLMSIMVSKLRVFWESQIKCCRALTFSHGGQFLALLQGAQVIVLNIWSYKEAFRLKYTNETGGVPIKSLAWSQDDSYMLTWTVDCLLTLWELNVNGASQKWQVCFPKNANIHASFVPYTASPIQVLVSTSSGALVQVDGDGNIVKEAWTKDCSFSHFVFNKLGNRIILGTVKGSVHVASFPLPEADMHSAELLSAGGTHTVARSICASGEVYFSKDKSNASEEVSFDPTAQKIKTPLVPLFGHSQSHPFEIKLHNTPVTLLALNYEDTLLTSCSSDGSIISYNIGFTEKPKDTVYSDEILTAASELAQQAIVQKALVAKIEEIRYENSLKRDIEIQSANEKLLENEAKFTAIVNELKTEVAQLELDKQNELQSDTSTFAETKFANKNEIEQLEEQFNKKMAAESEKFQKLEVDVRRLSEAHTTRTELAEKQNIEDIASVNKHFQLLINVKDEERLKFSELLSRKQIEHQQFLEALEEQTQQEISEIMTEFEYLLQQERNGAISIIDEKVVIKETFDKLNFELTETKKTLNKHLSEQKRLAHMEQSLERDKIGVQQELWERDETLKDKEVTISDLRKKAQELEKFKFVLDFKIKQLNKQIDPKEQDIRQLAVQIENMDNELADYHLANSDLDISMSEQQHHLKVRYQELEKARKLTGEIRETCKRMLNAFSGVALQYDKEPNLAKPRLVQLFHRYCAFDSKKDSSMAISDVDDEATQEQRRRYYLERSIKTLQRKAEQENQQHADLTARLLREHTSLLSEMNELQRDSRNKMLKSLEKVSLNPSTEKMQKKSGDETLSEVDVQVV